MNRLFVLLALALLLINCPATADDEPSAGDILLQESFDPSFRPREWTLRGAQWDQGVDLVLGNARSGTGAFEFTPDQGQIQAVLPLAGILAEGSLELWFFDDRNRERTFRLVLFEQTAPEAKSFGAQFDTGIALTLTCGEFGTHYMVHNGPKEIAGGRTRGHEWIRLTFHESDGQLSVYLGRTFVASVDYQRKWNALGVDVGNGCSAPLLIDDIRQYKGPSVASKESTRAEPAPAPFAPATLLSIYGGFTHLDPDDDTLMESSTGPRLGAYLTYRPWRHVGVGIDVSYATGGDPSDKYLFGLAVVELGTEDRRWYARGGYGIARAELNSEIGQSTLETDNGNAWSVAAGARFVGSSQFFVGLEVNYTSMGIKNDRGVKALGGLVSLNYLFNPPGPSPE